MPLVPGYHYGFAGPIGAHPIARELPPATSHNALGGFIGTLGEVAAPGDPDFAEIDNSRTYVIRIHRAHPMTNAAVQGAGGQRPYLLVSSDDGAATDAANARPADPSALPVAPPGTRTLRFEGVWVGSADDMRHEFVLERAVSRASGFDWDEVVLREATFDPGGVRGDGSPIAPLRLLVRGRVKRLVIERCIVGPILVERVDDCAESGFVEELVIHDSVVDAQGFDDHMAIDCVTGRVEIQRVTVFGNVDVALAQISDSIITGTLSVLNQQQSCLRFSAVSPGGILPRSFEAFGPARPSEGIVETAIARAFFTSLRFGDPGYGLLSLLAPIEIGQGAENGSEMGAFSSLLRPIRLNSIVSKVDEFKPAGVIAQYMLQGEEAPLHPDDEDS